MGPLWATTVMTPPVLLLTTAGETRMEATGGVLRPIHTCVNVLLYTVGVCGHCTVNVNKRLCYACLAAMETFFYVG